LEGGPLDPDIGYHTRREQRPPPHARAELRKAEDRRVRVGLLPDEDVLHVHGEAEGVDIQGADPHRVALQARIHVLLCIAAQGLVEHEADHNRRDRQQCNRPRQPHPPSSHDPASYPCPPTSPPAWSGTPLTAGLTQGVVEDGLAGETPQARGRTVQHTYVHTR
jgi:hypothetical protein